MTEYRIFRREYDRLYKQRPEAANLYLLICEIADEKERTIFKGDFPAEEVSRLISARFGSDPRKYAFAGGCR